MHKLNYGLAVWYILYILSSANHYKFGEVIGFFNTHQCWCTPKHTRCGTTSAVDEQFSRSFTSPAWYSLCMNIFTKLVSVCRSKPTKRVKNWTAILKTALSSVTVDQICLEFLLWPVRNFPNCGRWYEDLWSFMNVSKKRAALYGKFLLLPRVYWDDR